MATSKRAPAKRQTPSEARRREKREAEQQKKADAAAAEVPQEAADNHPGVVVFKVPQEDGSFKVIPRGIGVEPLEVPSILRLAAKAADEILGL